MNISLNKLFARFARDEEGVTLVEYGIAIVLAVTVGVGALGLLATAIGDKMDTATGVIDGSGTTTTTGTGG